jgi:hypothetical protein
MHFVQSPLRAVGSRRARSRQARRAIGAAALEALESRRLLSAYIVDSLSDAGSGSLRSAINAANTNSDSDTIEFDPALAGQTIVLHDSLSIFQSLTITGPAGGISVVRDLGDTNTFRIFSIESSVSIQGLTISGGRMPEGGGIDNHGNLTLTDCNVINNSVARDGGGIRNNGSLTAINCTISGNLANGGSSQRGGGIYSTGQLVLSGCTVSNNTLTFNIGGQGGGIYSDGALTVTDSTIANNHTGAGFGAGIYNGWFGQISNTTFSGNFGTGALMNTESVNLVNCTFSANGGSSGSAIFNTNTVNATNCTVTDTLQQYALWGSGAWTLNNCIVANTFTDATRTTRTTNVSLLGVVSGSNNILDDNSAPPSLGYTIADPRLGPLQDNGGPTLTHAIANDSPARNAGNNAAVPAGVLTDQRGTGFDRFVGAVDVGAFEIQNVIPTADAGGPYSVAEGGSVALDGSGSSDPEQSTASLSFAWDLDNDGQFDDATGISPTFSAAQLDGPATLTIGLQVTNTAGESDTGTATINLTNAAPTAIINGAPVTSAVNTQINLTGAFTDPSPLDTIAAWTWTVLQDGQGFATGNQQDFSFTPTAIGTYSLSLVVTDDDGAASLAAASSITVTGAQVTPDPQDPGATTLIVSGGPLDDVIIISGGNGKNIVVTVNGFVAGTFDPDGRVIVRGGDGDDTIVADGKLTVPVLFFGEAGNDTLTGGGAEAILVGGDGDDLLTSDKATDLIIGGAGSDSLNGGKGDDILVGGTTSFDAPTDQNILSLILIQDEWISNQNYNHRTGHIAGTLAGGVNAPNFLNSTTVFDDGLADVLTGGKGQDWFFGSSTGAVDTIDNAASEILVNIHS